MVWPNVILLSGVHCSSVFLGTSYLLYNKRVRPSKNEPQQGISYLEREREGVREAEGWVSGPAGKHI